MVTLSPTFKIEELGVSVMMAALAVVLKPISNTKESIVRRSLDMLFEIDIVIPFLTSYSELRVRAIERAGGGLTKLQ